MTIVEMLEPTAPPLRYAEDVIYVGDTRLPLDTVIGEYLNGASADEIALAYDVLDLADVHAVISHYLRHRDEIDAYLAERAKAAKGSRKKHESHWPAHIRERLLARERRTRRA